MAFIRASSTERRTCAQLNRSQYSTGGAGTLSCSSLDLEGEGLHLGLPGCEFPQANPSQARQLLQEAQRDPYAPDGAITEGLGSARAETCQKPTFWEVFGQGQALLAKGTNDLALFPMLMLSSGVTALHQLVPKSVL